MPARKRIIRPGDCVILAGETKSFRVKAVKQVKPKRCRTFKPCYVLSDGRECMDDQIIRSWS